MEEETGEEATAAATEAAMAVEMAAAWAVAREGSRGVWLGEETSEVEPKEVAFPEAVPTVVGSKEASTAVVLDRRTPDRMKVG